MVIYAKEDGQRRSRNSAIAVGEGVLRPSLNTIAGNVPRFQSLCLGGIWVVPSSIAWPYAMIYHVMVGDIFIIRGGRELRGEISVSGSKNTALPCIAAALLTKEPVMLENVPDILDVRLMAEIAKGLGAQVEWASQERRLTIRAANLSSFALDDALARKLRGSLLFSGALIGRLGGASLPYPGGDAIGARPLTTHLSALLALGVSIEDNGRVILDGKNIRGALVALEETSVTATENTILAAVLAPGKTVIRLAACEPHVQELIKMLAGMGANIRWSGVSEITTEGVEALRGAEFRLNPDELEISSFAALAAATRSEIAIRGVLPEYLDAVLLQLAKMGVEFRLSGDILSISKPRRSYQGFRLQSGLYPKLGSDHLPPFAVLATQAAGTSLIHEWLYEGRLRYIDELQKMGANAMILDPHRALIIGPTPLSGREISSLDIRSGMTLIIAALTAAGETRISDIHHIDRGYEKIDERLRALGAEIQRIKS